MAPKQVIVSEKGLKSPLFSQAIVHNGTVYVSGNIGIVPSTMQVVEGSVAERTVCLAQAPRGPGPWPRLISL